MQANLRNNRAGRIKMFLSCPDCDLKLRPTDDSRLLCSKCGRTAPTQPKINFLQNFTQADHGPTEDCYYKIKQLIKRRSPRIYSALIKLISPVYGRLDPLGDLLPVDPKRDFVIDLGSGSQRYHPDIINFDHFPYEEVDVVCSIDSLPLSTNSVDAVICIAVLEHVPNPADVVHEIWRVLKPGGRTVCFVPFMQGIHAAPSDYQRYTPIGLQHLFREFEDFSYVTCGGPASALAWILQEWLAIFFSFGIKPLYWLFYLLSFSLFPLKFLDILMSRHPMAEKIASGFLFSAIKPLNKSAT